MSTSRAPLTPPRPVASLTGWLEAPRPDTGLSLLSEGSSWRTMPYTELAARVLGLAAMLRDRGAAGQRTAIAAAGPEEFVTAFFAVLATGGTCVPVIPPQPLEAASSFVERARHAIELARPGVFLHGSGEAPPSDYDGLALAIADAPSDGPAVVDDPAPVALVQFSSGSTGAPKGIRLDRDALASNVEAIRTWLGMGDGDCTATWLPLHHDMGLIGTMITPVVTQTDLQLMTPLQFIRSPETWLRCFGERGATLTAAPAFAYDYVARKVDPVRLPGLDLGSWRVAIIGAEPLRQGTIDAFVDAFGSLGFSRSAFCPAYGLAEATLVVTATPVDEAPVVHRTSSDRPAVVADGSLSSGRPLDGFGVSVRDPDGNDVPDGTPGEIWVLEGSIAEGYEAGDGGAAFVDGELRTGDAGCMLDGELFVLGRIADSVKVRGEWLLAEEAERRVVAVVPDLRSVVVVPARRGEVGLTVVIEGASRWTSDRHEDVTTELRRTFAPLPVELLRVDRGAVPRTTSGKPRRRECWQRFVAQP